MLLGVNQSQVKPEGPLPEHLSQALTREQLIFGNRRKTKHYMRVGRRNGRISNMKQLEWGKNCESKEAESKFVDFKV